ncbi:hypothetical protein FO519_009629 [Halicephalobus sp. NKZ332]|nr:hypothetical protein FO519_009629 [Halicephalobus sp. NKZ332]
MSSSVRPLSGIKVIEIAGLAPVPLCGQILADFGAEVTLVSKKKDMEQRLIRGKKHISLDFKKELPTLRSMILNSDVLLEPYRPGVLEAIGLDPVDLMKENEKLIVARLTGYGQTGDLSREAGHDINYVSLSGLLPIVAGHNRKPYWTPGNLLADFAGGGLTCAFGIMAALVQRNKSGGKGSVVDCSMVEGLAYLGNWITNYSDMDLFWHAPYAAFSGDCPIYRTFETKDGKFMSVGALEGKFNITLFKILGIKAKKVELVENPQKLVDEMEHIFKTKTRDEWTEIFLHADCCVAPVLELNEVGELKHHQDRENFIKDEDGKWLPKPAPRLYTREEFAQIRQQDLDSRKSKL